MYYIMNDNKIVLADNDLQRLTQTLSFMPQYAEKEILETDKEIENFMFVDSEEWIEWKSLQVKSIRNNYLEKYVDPMVMNPLRWADMSQEQQDEVKNYRLYLLGLDTLPEFPKVEVLTYEDWKNSQS